MLIRTDKRLQQKISKGRQTQRDLPADVELFQKVFEETPLAMAIVDSDYRFVKANALFCKILDYTERELLDLTLKDIMHSDNITEDEQSIKKIFKGKLTSYRVERLCKRKDQLILRYAVTISAIHREKNKSQYLLLVVEDIAEQKKNVESLQTSEEWFRTFADTTFTAIFIYQGEQFVYVNNASELISGYTKG